MADALATLPITAGDVLFCHSNIGTFGRMAGAKSAVDVSEAIFGAVMDRITPAGTLVAPAFTYSFPRKEVFDPTGPILGMGAFSEWLRNHKSAYRSLDPCYSVVAVGGRAKVLTQAVSENSFAADSFFDRFDQYGGKILNLNFDAGSTYIHYVERRLGVPYRFDKTYEGMVRTTTGLQRARSTISVRYLSDPSLEAAFEAFHELSSKNGYLHKARLGRGSIGLISAADTCELIARTLPVRPWFLTKAERDGVRNPKIEPESQSP